MDDIGSERADGASQRETIAERGGYSAGRRGCPVESRVRGRRGGRVGKQRYGMAVCAVLSEKCVDNALNAAVTGWRHGDEGVGGEENAHRLQVIRRARSANSA